MKKSSCIAVVALTGCVAIGTAIFCYEQAKIVVRAAYVEWGVVQLIEAYAAKNNGELPNDWEDLAPFFVREGNLVSCESLSVARSFVDVDFVLLRDCRGDSDDRIVSKRLTLSFPSVVDTNKKLSTLRIGFCKKTKAVENPRDSPRNE